VQFDKEGQVVMSASLDKTIRVWDPRAGPDPVRMYQTCKGLTTITLNSDGSRLYYGPGEVNLGYALMAQPIYQDVSDQWQFMWPGRHEALASGST
jgi:WD40 repeat protein